MTERPRAAGRLRRALALVLPAVLLASACATIPTSGPIEQGAQIGGDREDQFVRVIARPPRPDMTPTQLVDGFLQASASFDGDHAVARDYLTPAASRTWKPDLGVRVYDNLGMTITEQPAGALTATGGLDGSISVAGQYGVAEPGKQLSAKFAVTSIDGQWRISSLPDGLILSRSDVDRAFRTYDVYFFDPTYSVLVPDPRTVPVLGPGLPTTLVQRLLDGPTPWLAPAVRTAIPAGTDLGLAAVPLDGGVARVDLTAAVLGADDRTRQALSAQLVWTLRQLPDVAAVDISVGGQPLPVPGVGSPQPQDAWPTVDPGGLLPPVLAYAVDARGRPVALDPDGTRVLAAAAALPEQSFAAVSVAPDQTTFAVLGADARSLWTGGIGPGSTMDKRVEAAELSRPNFDRYGQVWYVDRGPRGGVRLLRKEGKPISVPVDGLSAGTAVLGLSVARDGTRAALLTRTGATSTLLLARIERRGDTVRLAAPRRVEVRLTDVADVAWDAADQLAVLGSDGAGPTQAFVVDIARGQVRAVGAPTEPRSIAAGPAQPLLIGAADSKIYVLSGGAWQVRVPGRTPTYPG